MAFHTFGPVLVRDRRGPLAGRLVRVLDYAGASPVDTYTVGSDPQPEPVIVDTYGYSPEFLTSDEHSMIWLEVGGNRQLLIAHEVVAAVAAWVAAGGGTGGGGTGGTSGPITVADVPDLPASKITSGTFAAGLIPDLPAAKITGTLAEAQIPALAAAAITTGAFHVDRIPGLPASKVTSGTFAAARLPLATTAAAGAMSATDKAKLDGIPAGGGTGGTGTPTAHTHPASDIDSGTFADARIPALDASKTTTGTFADARIPALNASKTNAGVFNAARLPAVTTTTQGAMLPADKVKLDGIPAGGGTGGSGGSEPVVDTTAGTKITWNGHLLSYASGRRDVSSSLATGWTRPGSDPVVLYRNGDSVTLELRRLTRTSTTIVNLLTLPPGFRPPVTIMQEWTWNNYPAVYVEPSGIFRFQNAGDLALGWTNTAQNFSFTTFEAPPTSLPGTPA